MNKLHALTFIAVMALTGCGPGQGDITGTAKYKIAALMAAGATVASHPDEVADLVAAML